MYMLEVKYDMRIGYYMFIFNEFYYLVISYVDKFIVIEKVKLRLLIIK